MDRNLHPPLARKQERKKRTLEASKNLPFAQCAEQYFIRKIQKSEWHEKTRKEARRRLEKFAYPKMKNVPIREIDHLLIDEVLSPLWAKGFESSAIQLRKDIEAIFRYAKVKLLLTGDNPASKEGPLGDLVPRPSTHVIQATFHCPTKKSLHSWQT
jgi:hypothetical protein